MLFSKIIIYLLLYLWIITAKHFVIRNCRGTCASVGMLKG